jgi:hypothetical protein
MSSHGSSCALLVSPASVSRRIKQLRLQAIDWERYENNIYDKITYWFKVSGKVLQDLAILSASATTYHLGIKAIYFTSYILYIPQISPNFS